MKDLNQLAEITGVSADQFRGALGIVLDLSDISTVRDAREVYWLSEDAVIKSASLARWEELVPQEIALASTAEEVREIHRGFPCDYDSDIKRMVYERWEKLALAEVEKTTTVDELQEMRWRLPERALEASLVKWLGYCSTIWQVKGKYDEALDDSRVKRVALERWDELCLIVIDRAFTIEKAEKAFGECSINGKSREVAYQKWHSLCLIKAKEISTAGGAAEVFRLAPHNSEAAQIAHKKWVELSSADVKRASTATEAKNAWCVSERFSEIESHAFKKWLDLCTTIEEGMEAVSLCQSQSMDKERHMALRRVHEIWLSQ